MLGIRIVIENKLLKWIMLQTRNIDIYAIALNVMAIHT